MIESMTHVVVVADRSVQNAALSWLYRAGALHLMPFAPESADTEAALARLAPDPEEVARADAHAARLSAATEFCREHVTNKPSFLDQLLPVKVMTKRVELSAARAVASETVAGEVAGLRASLEKAVARVARAERRLELSEKFAFVAHWAGALRRCERVSFRLVEVRAGVQTLFLEDARVGSTVSAECVHESDSHRYFGLAASADHGVSLDDIITDYALTRVELGDMDAAGAEATVEPEAELATARSELETAHLDATRYADARGRELELARAHWESERIGRRQQTAMVSGAHVFAARGYVKSSDLEGLRGKFEKRFPGAVILEDAMPAGESPPTSLKWNSFTRPASLLVKMYGVPSYRGIDPTPWVAVVFFCFVGICLGDVVYGALLIAAMLGLKKKYRDQPHLGDFFQLFVYCGIMSMIFGALTGGWMGDLSAYLAKAFPALEPINTFRVETLTLVDPITDAQKALMIAVAIGVGVQFYALMLRAWLHFRRGEWIDGFGNGLFWVFFLGGLVSFGLAQSGVLPVSWSQGTIIIMGVAALGLVLTQSREGNWFMRIMVGCISLYGIVGSYGISAFLGDTLSYARLMALLLTSAALGGTFNMLAEMTTGLGIVGIVAAVLLVLGGHLMNFFLSALSAFVHSARLVLLEIFGRAFESGGYAYAPHGFRHLKVEVTDAPVDGDEIGDANSTTN